MARLDNNKYALRRTQPPNVDVTRVSQENVREVVLELDAGEHDHPPDLGEDRIGNAVGARRFGMIISHGCELDKETAHPMVAVAQVRPLAGVHPDDRTSIRTYHQKRSFYLPLSKQLGEEHYADFRYITTLRRDVIDSLTRVACMNPEGRDYLHFQLVRFFARRRLPPGWTDWPVETE